MPTPAEDLNKDSPNEAIKEAISSTVSQLVNEGFEQEQAVAIAFRQASKATGKDLGQTRQGSRVRRSS